MKEKGKLEHGRSPGEGKKGRKKKGGKIVIMKTCMICSAWKVREMVRKMMRWEKEGEA